MRLLNTSVFRLIPILCSLVSTIDCKCTTTFITTCEKVSEIARYGKDTWSNLIIAKDPCGNSESQRETLQANNFHPTPNLEELYIAERLTDIKPSAFDGLNHLTYLKLHKNELKVIKRGAFSNFVQLLKLDLQDNSIENIEHGLFSNSSIASINLSNNKLNNLQVNMVNIPSLKKLIIKNNAIVYLVANCFHENLQHLNLDGNLLQNVDKKVLEPLKNLKELILSHNKFEGLALEYGLPSLETLDLSHNVIQEIAEGALKQFFELRHLDLSHNHIVELKYGMFPENNAVTHLYLHRNALMNIDVRVGQILAALQEISVSANPWSCVCLRDILEYLERRNVRQPQCDKEFLSDGRAPICLDAGGECRGNEIVTREIFEEYQSSIPNYQC